MKYKNVVWDWNGTLLNDVKVGVNTLNDMLGRRGLPLLSVEDYKEKFGFPVIDFYDRVGFDMEKESFHELSVDFVETYDKYAGEVGLNEGVREVLAGIQQTGVKQYVLSPQSDLDKVRRYLAAHGFAIEDEAMVKDEGKYYTVMSVKRGFMEYESQAHYLYGKILIDKKDVILREYLGREMLRIEKILVSLQAKDGITDTETRAEARISRQKELSWIKEAQDEMQ